MNELIVARKKSTTPLRIDASMTLWRMVDKSVSPHMDFVMTHIDGAHSRRMNRRSTKLYFVTKGTVDFIVGGQVTTVEAGDVCIIPPGVWCEIKGTSADVAIVCSPAFDPED